MSLDLLGGYLVDPHDPRDFGFGALRPMLGATNLDEECIIPVTRTPRDQTGQSCVGNAWCRALEILSDLKGKPLPELSAQFLYWVSRQRHVAETTDSGTYLRSAADALSKFGVPASSACPDDLISINQQPPTFAFVTGHDARIDSYYRISESGRDGLDQIEIAVRTGHPVVFGVGVAPDFVRGTADFYGAPEHIVGRHAMVVIGVRDAGDERQFRWLNSWGPSWGSNGQVWVNSPYMDMAMDKWVGTAPP